MINGISEKVSSSEVIILNDITSTIICRIAFGKKLDEMQTKRFEGLLLEGQIVMSNFYFSDHFPLLGWLDKLLGCSAWLERNFKEMDLFYQEVIDEHLCPTSPSSMQDDIVYILLKLKRDSQSSSIDLTIDNIKAIVMDIFIAGTETTAGTIIWTMTCLIKNPRTLIKATEEVRKLMDGKTRITEEDLQNIELPYLDAVLKESMRLYPIAPFLVPRESMNKCVINGYEIKPKTIVYVSALATGKNPEELFSDRFLDSDVDFKGQDFELIPFGGGHEYGSYYIESPAFKSCLLI